MKFIAVIDTNVLVSALMKADSIPAKIIELVRTEIILPITHEKILDEYRTVLSRAQFGFEKADIDTILDLFTSYGISLDGIPADTPVGDPKDVVFYEVTLDALQTDPAYLVTGNIRHFPIRPFVVTPRQMLEIVEKNL